MAYEEGGVSMDYCKTIQYVQHPVPVKGCVAEAEEVKLATFLTKKERKRLRKQAR